MGVLYANSGSCILLLLSYKVDNYYPQFATEEAQDSDATLTFLRSKVISISKIYTPGQSDFKACVLKYLNSNYQTI